MKSLGRWIVIASLVLLGARPLSSASSLSLSSAFDTVDGWTVQAGEVGRHQVKAPSSARLESVLYQLTQADDPKEFARRHAIVMVEARVQVVVELDEGDALDMGTEVVIESRYQNLVRARVPIDQLLPLSQQKGVRFIRLPQRPVANNE